MNIQSELKHQTLLVRGAHTKAVTPGKKKIGVSAHVRGQQPAQPPDLHLHINDEAVQDGVKPDDSGRVPLFLLR